EVHGNPDAFERIREDEAWAWALYPPNFYLRGYPVPAKARTGTAGVQLGPDDASNNDVALYMMEHNEVADVTSKISKGSRVEIAGRADLMGEPADFQITWSAPAGR